MKQNEKSGSVTGAMGIQGFKEDSMTRVKEARRLDCLFFICEVETHLPLVLPYFKIKPKLLLTMQLHMAVLCSRATESIRTFFCRNATRAKDRGKKKKSS